MVIPIQGFKKCSKCKKEKPLLDYYKRKNGSPLAECKVCTRKRSLNYKERNLKYVCERQVRYGKKRRARVKEAVFAAYGGYKCACCGETEKLFLTIDHINNNGAAHRREIVGKRTGAGYPTYNWLANNNFPEGYQVLCMNCNHGKRMNNGICPHKARCNDYPKGVEPSGSKRIAPHLRVLRG